MQSGIIFAVLISAGSAMLLLSYTARGMRRRYVRGSRERYVAKSLEVLFTICTMLFHSTALFIGVFMFEASAIRVVSIATAAFVVVFYIKIIIRLISDGDDDWFNDSYKKCQKRLKRLRALKHTRSAPRPTTA